MSFPGRRRFFQTPLSKGKYGVKGLARGQFQREAHIGKKGHKGVERSLAPSGFTSEIAFVKQAAQQTVGQGIQASALPFCIGSGKIPIQSEMAHAEIVKDCHPAAEPESSAVGFEDTAVVIAGGPGEGVVADLAQTYATAENMLQQMRTQQEYPP